VFTYWRNNRKGELSTDRPIKTDTKRGWYGLIEDAGIQPIKFHDLRATYGTRLEELGVPPAVSMALMGHKRKSVRDRYIRATLPMLREAIQKLDKWLGENDLLHTYYTKTTGRYIEMPVKVRK
jgi:integrase